jgi:ADP-heptose:LPS heptosyltransferase
MSAPAPGVVEDVRKIAVLAPNSVGDFVFTLPALHALQRAYPQAELALVGKPWHRALLHGRPGPVGRVLLTPPVPGVGMPADAPCDPQPAEAFLAQMRKERFDIAVQMFGGGRYSNPFVKQFGARLAIGARADDAPPLDRWVRYAVPNNRRLALLELAALAGAAAPPLGRELAVTEADRREAADALAAAGGRPLAVLQPGSTDPRRCWPAASFAQVGDALAQAGAVVAVNGTAAEAPLVRTVIAQMRQPALDLSGQLSLAGLCGLLDGAALMVSNDTGPLHLALAVGTPSVGIFWFTNLVDGTPLRQHLLHAALSLRLHCPVCGAENVRYRCPHDPSFVDDVPVEQVTGMATALLRAGMHDA